MRKSHLDDKSAMPSTWTPSSLVSKRSLNTSEGYCNYQTFDPILQMEKSFEASVNIVPLNSLSADPEIVHWWVLMKRLPSNILVLGFLDSLCLISQAGTHALSPTDK